MLDLTLGDLLLNRASHVFGRHARVDTMLVKEVYAIGLETRERSLGHKSDALRPAIESGCRVAAQVTQKGLGPWIPKQILEFYRCATDFHPLTRKSPCEEV